jgi:hypothetical protein
MSADLWERNADANLRNLMETVSVSQELRAMAAQYGGARVYQVLTSIAQSTEPPCPLCGRHG